VRGARQHLLRAGSARRSRTAYQPLSSSPLRPTCLPRFSALRMSGGFLQRAFTTRLPSRFTCLACCCGFKDAHRYAVTPHARLPCDLPTSSVGRHSRAVGMPVPCLPAIVYRLLHGCRASCLQTTAAAAFAAALMLTLPTAGGADELRCCSCSALRAWPSPLPCALRASFAAVRVRHSCGCALGAGAGGQNATRAAGGQRRFFYADRSGRCAPRSRIRACGALNFALCGSATTRAALPFAHKTSAHHALPAAGDAQRHSL
jgi:hypothetical protein